MSYSVLLPPALTAFGPLTSAAGSNFWVYKEAATFDVIRAAGYISNARALGMKVGDSVLHWDVTSASAPILTFGRVTAIATAAAGGGATIAATGTPIV